MEAIAATVDITPVRLLAAACHGPRNRPAARIALPFEANILALREADRLLVIVSMDWFFIGPGMRPTLLARCRGMLADDNLIVAASHTHNSPNTDETKVGFSAPDPNYIAEIEERVAGKVERMLRGQSWKPVALRFTTVHCDCAMHRRRFIWWPKGWRLQRKMEIYPNPAGPSDKDLRLLRIEAEDNSLLAVLWGVSCHPTEWPYVGELSPDYPGVVRQTLRSHLRRSVPVVFLQGFCGDLRPPALGFWALRASWRVRAMLALCSLINGRFFAGFTPAQYQRWANRIAESALRAVDQAASQPKLPTGLSIRRTTIRVAAIGLQGEIDEMTVHSFDLGDELRVVCVSAEIVWEYAELVRRTNPGRTIWPVGYIDQVFGYLPTADMLAEGGYEVNQFKPLFGMEGVFLSNTEEIMRNCLAGEPVLSVASGQALPAAGHNGGYR